MWEMLGQSLVKRYTWLDPNHPIALLERRRNLPDLPKFVRRLSDLKTMLSFAALIHGVFFLISVMSYSRIHEILPGIMVPFMTPFGTAIVAAGLHTVLYWMLLLGICNFTSLIFATDMETGMWTLLRVTPYSMREIILAKIVSVFRIWGGVIGFLILTRAIASIVLPISLMIDAHEAYRFDMMNVFFFIIEPLIDVILVSSLSAFAALLMRNTVFARGLAYGLSAAAIGFYSSVAGLWLTFTAPLGSLSTLLVPGWFWGFFTTAVSPIRIWNEHVVHLVILFFAYIVLPLGIAYIAFRGTLRLARQEKF